MMARLAIIVEGLTEKNFVDGVLSPHLSAYSVAVSASNLKGKVSLPRLQDDIRKMVHNMDFVSTMVDYYGFGQRGGMSAEDIERELKSSVSREQQRKIIPYVQRHEFEALMFAGKDAIADHLRLSQAQRQMLERINEPPEDIDDDCPPSKRLLGIYDKYQKPLDGVEIARRIGLSAMMDECPRFAAWVKNLESLGKKK